MEIEKRSSKKLPNKVNPRWRNSNNKSTGKYNKMAWAQPDNRRRKNTKKKC